VPPGETQQQRRHQLVHCDAAIVATNNKHQDTQFKIVCKAGSTKNKKQHAIRCESIHIDADDGQLTVQRTAGVGRELHDQFIAACNGKPPFSTKAFVHTVREIELHDIVGSGTFGDKSGVKRPQEWTKQGSKTFGGGYRVVYVWGNCQFSL